MGPVFRSATALALAVVVAGATVSTQEGPLRTTIAASSIEVEVRDARGNSVTGLTAADFLVTENHEQRKVISAEYLRPRMLPRPSAVPQAAPDVTTNRDTDTTGAVLFVLDDSTPMLAADGLRVIQLVTDAIGRVPTSEHIGLFFAAATKLNVPFSQDRARLTAAARRFNARADLRSVISASEVTPTSNGAAFVIDESSETLYRNTIHAIRIAVETLAAQPYRRKSLVLFSAGLPMPLGDQPGGSALVRELIRERQALVAAANDAGIAINAVDPAGLRADFGSVRSEKLDAPTGGTGRLNREFLIFLARGTGGLAAVGTNDPSAVVTRMLDDAGAFYLLRFESDPKTPREVPTTIAVTTPRGTATIRRRGIVTGAADKTPALAGALVRTTPGVPLDLALIAVPTALGRPSALIATVKVDRSTKGTPTSLGDKFTLVVSAYGVDGKPAASRTTHINTVLPSSEDDIQFEIVTRLDLGPGWYSVRAAIQTDKDPKIGSVLGDIEIPSHGKPATALSGIALTASPPLMSAPKTALEGLRMPVPTALRVFRATDHLTAFAFLSSDRKPAPAGTDVDFQVLTDDGDRISAKRRRLSPDDLSAGIAQVAFPVDLAGLRPGGYWVTFQIVAADGTTSKQSSWFEVR